MRPISHAIFGLSVVLVVASASSCRPTQSVDVCPGGPCRVVRHSMSRAVWEVESQRWTERGYRLVDISGYTEASQPRFAAIWERASGPEQLVRVDVPGIGYQAEYNNWRNQGYRLRDVSGYDMPGGARYATLWERVEGPNMVARHGLTPEAYQAEFDMHTAAGYRLTQVSGYADNGATRYAAIWEQRAGPAWQARHGLSAPAYQTEFDQLAAAGYGLLKVSGHAAGGDQYAAIWERTNTRRLARHGLSPGSFQSEIENQRGTGYRIAGLSAFASGNSPRFAAVWEGGGLSSSDETLIRDLVEDFMSSNNIPGLSLAVSKDGRLVYARGFGFADQGRSLLVGTEHRFRIASVSKPITAAAIMKLVEDGEVALSDTVFGTAGILGTQYGTPPYGPGITDITVEHLLHHRSGGWPNDANDPMFLFPGFDHDQLISAVLDTMPLTNPPGTSMAYSNFGFAVLGRVIEEVTGQSYEDYVLSAILQPAGVKSMQIGDDAGDASREVIYYGNPFDDPYAMDVDRMDSHGGWIATASDLLRFAAAVDGFNTRPDVLSPGTVTDMTSRPFGGNRARGWVIANGQWWHTGIFSGGTSVLVRRDDGISYAILANIRSPTGLKVLGDDIVQRVSGWPAYDLF